jgi:Domain of unknown function (DUF4351)
MPRPLDGSTIDLSEFALRERSLILRLLTCRVDELPASVRSHIDTLSLDQLEALGEALLDFAGLADLQQWLAALADDRG